MKNFLKFVIVSMFLFCAIAAGAQTVSMKQTASNPNGTISNASVDTMSLHFNNSWQKFSVQPVVTKSAGTMAGKARLFLSNDGVNYIQTDSLSLSDQTVNTGIFTVNTPIRYVMVTVGGATTVTATAAAKITVGP